MDPNAALEEILENVFHMVDYSEARDRAVDLQDWLTKGGANPDFTQGQCELMMDCIFQMVAELA